MVTVDLNSDLGESFGAFTVGQDEVLLSHISSANIACGYHAGDHNVMARTVEMAAKKGVSIGAHPGYPDLAGFGRRYIETSPSDIYHFVIYQISALKGFCTLHKVPMRHVKPHGALYNAAATNEKIAQAIAQAVYDCGPNLVLFGLSGSKLIKAGEEHGLRVANEVFADRTYQSDGTLTPRTNRDATIHNLDIATKQVIQMVKTGTVRAIDGSIVRVKADTICLHGDGPNAVEFATQLKETLREENIMIKPVIA